MVAPGSRRRDSAWTWAAAVCGLLVATRAPAQEPVGDETPATVVVEAPPPYGDGHRWVDLRLGRNVQAVAVTEGGVLLALDDRGAVWRWRSGRDWRKVLASLLEDPEEVDDELILLEVESAVDDFMQGAGDVEDPADDAAGDPTEDVDLQVDDIDATDAVEAGLLDTDDGAAARAEAPVGQGLWSPRGWPGVVICSRDDGTWWSGDNGWSWAKLTTLPKTYAIIEDPFEDGVLVAGTVEGLRHSPDGGRTWLQVSDVVGGLPVLAMATDGEVAYAGTIEGLFASRDGITWARLIPPRYADTPVFAVATDPSWSAGIWLAAPEGVLRSDDGGEHLRPPAQNPLIGTRTFLVLPEAGHVLAAGSDGVWESIDGGTRWRPLAEGLRSADQAALVLGPDGPVAAGPHGVYRLARSVRAGASKVVETPSEVLPPVGEVVMVAIRRTGVDIEPLVLQRALVRSLLAPQVSLEASLAHRRALGADFSAVTNDGSDAMVWTVSADLCFGACGSTSSTSAAEVDADFLYDDGQVVVIDGEAFFAEDGGSYSAASANVGERISKYRTSIADSVAGLYFSRQRLARERAGISGLPLHEQVEHELGIQEVTARLDAWTDGYFSRAIDGPDSE